MVLELRGLQALDPALDGTYELWAFRDGEAAHIARVVLPADSAAAALTELEFELPFARPDSILLGVAPPGDPGTAPPAAHLLEGRFRGDVAELTIEGAVTDGRPLVREPGHHSLFTTSNNVELGYPSFENAGLWMFSISISINPHGNRFVHLTPLTRAWTYEGWIVYRPGMPEETWISFGKYRPDLYGMLTSRDNTGSGVFSGDEDYLNAGVEDVPGEEWHTNLFGYPVPGGFELPLALDAVDADGVALWYHTITIEPVFDESEPLFSERPFPLRPYRNPIGEGGPGIPRKILYRDNDPSGVVRPRR